MAVRSQTTDFLIGRSDERPPFVALVTELAARLQGVDVDALERDAGALSRSMLSTRELLRLPVLTLRWPAAGLEQAAAAQSLAATEAAAVVAEVVHRLRILAGPDAPIAVLLPGPLSLVAALGGDPGSFDDVEDAGTDVLNTLKAIEPESIDVFGLFEPEVGDSQIDDLADVLSSVWNAAHYYSSPALFVAAAGGTAVAAMGSDAVAVLQGPSADELLAAGAARAGVPVAVGDPARSLPRGGFYVSHGELDATADIADVQALIERTSR